MERVGRGPAAGGCEVLEVKGATAGAVAALPAAPMAAQSPEAEPSIDGCSVSSEWECPVCYQLYCEPVRAGCERHVFCRNCLMKAQRLGTALKCPICRAESRRDVADMPEVAELVEKLKKRDDRYEERVASARREREELIHNRLLRVASLTEARATRQFEVHGAGSDEVNGVYAAGVLPTYVGPTVYRKPNSHMFIFRWHQTLWIIAELNGPYSMGNEREWLYRAPTQYPPDIPPMHGWEVPALGRACSPAPEVRIVRGAVTAVGAPGRPPAAAAARGLSRRDRPGAPGSGPGSAGGAAEGGHEDAWWPVSGLDGDQVRCRCAPYCSVM